MIKFKHYIFIILIITTSINIFAGIEVFTTTTLPFKDDLKDVCYLDMTQNTIADLNFKLQSIKNEGEIDKVLDQSSIQAITNNVQCRSRASELGINKVPAIVFDNQYVVYGARDIKTAQMLLRKSKDG